MEFLPKSTNIPNQKVPDSQKTDSWYEDSIDGCESLILTGNSFIRENRLRKAINYDLYSGKLHESDMETIINPMGLKDIAFPNKVENHALCNPYIKALIGEEIKRRFDVSVKVENEDAISEKEKAKKEQYMQLMERFLTEDLPQPDVEGLDPNSKEYKQKLEQYQEQLTKELEQKQKYINYEWQDVRELAAERLLKYYAKKEELDWKFTQGFEDALISTEELYCIDVIANEPIARKCNPLTTHFQLPPSAYKLEDADQVVEELYMSLGDVIDTYYDELKPEWIDYLESKTNRKASNNYGNIPNNELEYPTFSLDNSVSNGTVYNYNLNNFMAFDANSNIRVVKCSWRGMRKVGILSFPDENGEMQKTIVPDTYKLNKNNGESVEWKWIGEWYEGTKIANKYYVKKQVKPVQFRSLNNLSRCESGYVGTIYKTNSSQPQSLLDIIKPYQYAYNVIYHRFKLMLSNNIGKVMKLDLAKVPDGWQPDKWIYYAKVMNIAVIDSFKEAKKGAATGKLAGNMTANSEVLDLELGNSFQQMIAVLENIKQELDLITGISASRRGEKNDDGLGVTQENKLASANITEWYFKLHDNTKTRVYQALLEIAKYCLRNGNKTIQYIEDDMTSQIYTIDGELVNECEYGLFVRDANSDREAIQMLRKASEIALQTGTVDVVQLMDIFSNQSLASIRRKIEKSVSQSKEEQNKARQEELQVQQQEIQNRLDVEMQKLELKKYEIDANNQTKLDIAHMTSLSIDEGPNAEDISNVAESSLKQQELFSKDFMERQKHLRETAKANKEAQLKSRELDIKEKELKDKKAIEELKAKTSLQVARANKNKYDKK
jgi:hypothetical protein